MNRENEVPKLDIEQWLDDALAHYGNAEPRPGLETRILARLAVKEQRFSPRLGWGTVLGFAMAAVLAAILLLQLRTEPSRFSGTAAQVSVPARDGQSGVGSKLFPGATKMHARASRSTKAGRAPTPRVGEPGTQDLDAEQSAPSRLAQFPAPTPLSDQELLLARYVREFPQKAVLVARLQTELQQQDEREMAAPWPNNSAQQTQR